MKWDLISMGDIALRKGGSVDPKKHQGEVFELYSISAFDAGAPEVVAGSAIGSSKKAVQPDDVMISRIVPHIRRACVVGPSNGHRQIASGEWIIFRDERIWPKYLRWVLVGDVFHSAFMRTVSGVGGSLLRARPAEVFKIQVPLPPLAEQKRIATILDAADALRAKRREALAELDALLRSTFLDMFGDPVTNPKGLDIELLGELIEKGPQNGLYKPERYYGSGVRILRIDGFHSGVVNGLTTLKRVDASEQDVQKYGLSESDIVINRVNSRSHLGKSALIPDLGGEPVVFESNMMRLTVDSTRVSPIFMIHFLQTGFIRNQILKAAKDSINQASINQGDVKRLRILVPSVDSQRHFVSIAESIGHQKGRCCAHLAELDTLFASLQSRAFQGDL